MAPATTALMLSPGPCQNPGDSRSTRALSALQRCQWQGRPGRIGHWPLAAGWSLVAGRGHASLGPALITTPVTRLHRCSDRTGRLGVACPVAAARHLLAMPSVAAGGRCCSQRGGLPLPPSGRRWGPAARMPSAAPDASDHPDPGSHPWHCRRVLCGNHSVARAGCRAQSALQPRCCGLSPLSADGLVLTGLWGEHRVPVQAATAYACAHREPRCGRAGNANACLACVIAERLRQSATEHGQTMVASHAGPAPLAWHRCSGPMLR